MKTKYTNVFLSITIDNVKLYNQFKNFGVTLILFDKSSNSGISFGVVVFTVSTVLDEQGILSYSTFLNNICLGHNVGVTWTFKFDGQSSRTNFLNNETKIILYKYLKIKE